MSTFQDVIRDSAWNLLGNREITLAEYDNISDLQIANKLGVDCDEKIERNDYDMYMFRVTNIIREFKDVTNIA